MPSHQTTANPFAEVEALLARPHADGVFVHYIKPGSAPEAAGLRAGDTIVQVDGKAMPDTKAFYPAMQPKASGKPPERALEVIRADASRTKLTLPAAVADMHFCTVRRGESAWTPVPDYEEEANFSAFARGTEWLLRNSFGDETAGWERLGIERNGEELSVEIDFRIGGAQPDGKTWEFCKRLVSRHRLDRHLSLLQTTSYNGKPGSEKFAGGVELGPDGQWRGERVDAQGQRQPVHYPASAPQVLTGYAVTLLPVTMPLRKGASKTYFHANEGVGVATCRCRLECTGKKKVKSAGCELEAWEIAWRHYGMRPPEDDEYFYVTDERKIVRIDWGPEYGGCWCEAIPKTQMTKGVPKHLLVGVG